MPVDYGREGMRHGGRQLLFRFHGGGDVQRNGHAVLAGNKGEILLEMGVARPVLPVDDGDSHVFPEDGKI